MRRQRPVSRAAVAVLLTAALVGCGGDDTPPRSAPSAAATATAAAAAADPEAAAATAAAEQFLAALVAEDHDVAYGLLSSDVQSSLALEEFAAARSAKNGSARSLGRRYDLTDVAGEGDRRTITGQGYLADGTVVEISLPMARTDLGWRLDAQPTSY